MEREGEKDIDWDREKKRGTEIEGCKKREGQREREKEID
jgi:hypothetical protein